MKYIVVIIDKHESPGFPPNVNPEEYDVTDRVEAEANSVFPCTTLLEVSEALLHCREKMPHYFEWNVFEMVNGRSVRRAVRCGEDGIIQELC